MGGPLVKNKKNLFSVVVICFILIFASLRTFNVLNFPLSSTMNASPIGCAPLSLDPLSSEMDYEFEKYSDDITIQCARADDTWRNLRSAATLTNSTSRVNNYNKSGGQNQAWYDFQRMPGNQQQVGNGKYIKAYEEKTVTYYRSTTRLLDFKLSIFH
ncbi:hypothetical protein [Alkalibacillus haloalkaliphilus]|uniref:hypothetical protein n=1 Tax=Alkalibacillus haloalkaliphilus TaxID=94136 RepID=UPI0003680B03|nr:hypothetical protein [Alkalibacillus haloalkaliphilus]